MESPSSLGRMAAGLLLLVLMAWGVLRAGAALSAPPALGARWRLDTPLPCASEAEELELVQSGAFLDVKWPGGPAATLHGRWADGAVVLAGTGASCAAVRLEGTWSAEGLDARLRAPGCGACDGAPVHAGPVTP